ncbi:MAG: DsbA family oxidoreductase [Solirubrobacteraceae bacterium]|nr:DsbA family oxidoreductase [Solirubrobacteraceae bacterium]
MAAALTVEIWSDVVCPWCWIGETRFLRAAEALGVHDDLEIRMRAFRLDPDPDPPRIPSVARLQAKYGWSEADTLARMGQITELGAEIGLDMHPERAITSPTTDAHRLIAAAQPAGLDLPLMLALHAAYFTDGLDVGDHGVLARVAADTGLDAALTAEVLASERHLDDVVADEQQARAYQVGGVPFFVLDGRVGVSGAQPQELFERALAQTLEPTG